MGPPFCLSSAKLRSTDSVNPRAVLSRALPRYRLYSKHRDRRYWTGTSIGTRYQGPSFRTHEQSLLLEQQRNKRRGSAIGHQPSLHLNVVLSKAALSGPSVCLRARAPCPLRVSCLRIARERTGLVFPAGSDHWIAPSVQRSCRLWRSGGSLGQDRGVRWLAGQGACG